MRQLRAAGVRVITRLPHWQPGHVYYSPPTLHGVGAALVDLPRWIARSLTDPRRADIPAKLAAHPDVDQRHAFLWAEDRDGEWLTPVLDAVIPAGDGYVKLTRSSGDAR